MSNFFLKFKLILWKNFIIRKRHWILTLCEILMSVLIFLLLGYTRTLIPEFSKQFINVTQYHEPDIITNRNIDLFYSPNTTLVNNFMDKVSDKLQTNEFRGFENEKDLLAFLSTLTNNNETLHEAPLVGVIFDSFPSDKWPIQLKYRLRTEMNSIFGSLFPHSEPFRSYEKKYYFDKAFIDVQHALDKTFIEIISNNKLPSFELIFQEMPYPPHEIFEQMNQYFLTVLPFCTILAFIFMFPNVLKRVIEEKSSGIKELMKMMGLESWMLWLGWFMHSMVTNIPAITFIVIMLKIGISAEVHPIIEYSSAGVIWIFLVLYCASGICFSFAVSTLFKKATMGMGIGMIVWMFMFFISSPVITNDDPTAFKCLRNFLLLLPNACLMYGFKAISEFEKKETGLFWTNLCQKPNIYTPHPSMGAVLLMLIVDSCLFLIFTWYIDNVHPGEYGIARPWYFPFMKSYWFANKVEDVETSEDKLESCDEVEAVTSDLHVGVKIRNLHKEFNGKKAVNGLNLDIYNNQITVLLGHNGAGKTTTMNIITGMLGPTSGTVMVDGYSIYSCMNKVRESLGYCPQHNLQFPDLTVLEHLLFFAMLKGRSRQEAEKESHEFLSRLNLTAKANKMASELSGGMRRKLSLGMALVGRTRVLMLDEPTSGMDPEARREIWDFLLSIRGERTILITTHYMEEADILGDRIAIMHHGQLMCYGTSLFLKKHYGTGYTLSILVAHSWDINTISEAVQQYIQSANVKNISVGCITFVLPSNNTTSLSKLFLHLEKNKTALGINSFGVSITTMEEVFLRVGEIADEVDKSTTSKQSDNDSAKCLLHDTYVDAEKDKIKSNYLQMWQQFLALFQKRVRYTRHKWIIFLLQLCIPIGMVLFIVAVMKMEGGNDEPDVRRELTLAPYLKSETFYSAAEENRDLASFYAKTVQNQHSLTSQVADVSDAIVAVGEENMQRYHRTLIAAAEFNYSSTHNKLILNAMYGNWALHGPGISLNLITNALLKYVTGDAGYSISVTNNPLPSLSNGPRINLNLSAIMMWMFQFPVAFTIMIGFFLIFPQEERLSGVKHLQLMTGIPRALYWLTNYLYDLCIYIIVGILILFILLIFDNGGPFGNASAINALSSLMFIYGFAAMPFSYLFTYRPTASSSMNCLMGIQILFGTVATVAVIVLEHLDKSYATARDITSYILFFIPNFAFSHGIYRFTSRANEVYIWNHMDASSKKARCSFGDNPCCKPDSSECAAFYNYFDGTYSIKRNVIFMTVHIILYSAIFLFIDSGYPRRLLERFLDMNKDKTNVDNSLDEDVAEERKRVNTQINEIKRLVNSNKRTTEVADVLLVSNLRKWFRNFYAVRGLNFGVKTGECFGLLGINGAGKTTTFKMLTGDIFPSAGYANIMGFSLDENKPTCIQKIGYCPQFDALNFTLTTRQMLQLFAQLRGIQPSKVDRHVNKWIHKFGIKQYENVQCGSLSGGNKRKLSTAIALIGDPPLIMLDEPTSGVDPVARRNLWDILAVLRKSGQSIVLTSHSMDECEALCDRLAIMVDGQMKCIGNIQYLKNKFGQGFIIMVKLRAAIASAADTTDAAAVSHLHSIKNVIENRYTCVLKDEHTGMLLYHVTNPDASLAEIFNFMEELKANKEIVEDYAVSDTSLEQVFISFAKKKDNDASTIRSAAKTEII